MSFHVDELLCLAEELRQAIERHDGAVVARKLYELSIEWEEGFAKRLDELKIVWTRKVEIFRYVHSSGSERRYYPDFFLPEHDLFVEIKGMIDENVEPKLQAVRDAKRRIIILKSLEEIQAFDLALSSKGRMQGSQPCDGGFKSP